MTPELVQRLVERLFTREERDAANAMLDRYGTALHEREAVRVGGAYSITLTTNQRENAR